MADIEKLKQYNLITYILYILGFFVGVTPIIAVIMNYWKRDEMRGTWLESHTTWQIRTFWVSLIGYLIGGLLTAVLVGFAILFFVFVWNVYRLAKGLIALNNGQPVGPMV